MITIETRAHIGSDGMLSVRVPTTLRDVKVEVLVVLQPVEETKTGDSAKFLEVTSGAWQGEALERLP